VTAGEPVEKEKFKRVEQDGLTFYIENDFSQKPIEIRLRFFVFGDPIVRVTG